MINPYALLILMGTIVVLVAIQRGLSRIDTSGSHPVANATPSPEKEPATPQATPKPAEPRGHTLVAGLSVTGLDERGVNQLRELVKKGDIPALAMYLAGQRPNILELDEYLQELRAQFRKAVPGDAKLSDTDTIQEVLVNLDPGTPPAGLKLAPLNAKEHLALLTFDPGSQRLITRDFITLFGNQAFNDGFEYYCSHDKSTAVQIQTSHPDRQVLETLAQSGAADKGRHIPLGLRLTVLNMDQLRQMCKDLNKDIKFASKQELTNALSQIPGSAVLLSMQYTVDDLFILNPLKVDQAKAENEWNYLRAYAKLLTTA